MQNRDDFIADNLRLVHTCCHRFSGRGIEYDDLYQAGCIGLIKAADRFDGSMGFCFSTYAVPVILGEIRRLFRDDGPVKVSRSLKELSLKIRAEQNAIQTKLGRAATVSELAERLHVSPEEVGEALCASMPTVSLTYEDEEGEGQLDLPVAGVEEEVSEQLAIREVLDRLPENDRLLIEKRYFASKTQNQTAKELGMTQVQVSRREKKILLELRKMLC